MAEKRLNQPEVVVQGIKGTYIPKENLSDVDLPYEISGVRGEEVQPPPSDFVVPVGQVDTAVLYRLRLDDGRFVDAVEVWPSSSLRLLGVGREEVGGEPVYEESLEGKDFSEVELGDGLSAKDVVKAFETFLEDEEAVEEALDRGLLTEDDLDAVEKELSSEKPDAEVLLSYLKKALEKSKTVREVKSLFGAEVAGLVRAETPEKEDGAKKRRRGAKVDPDKVKALSLKKTLSPEEFREKGEKLTLNGFFVGVDAGGRVRIVYAPERIKTLSATAFAKALNNAEPDYYALYFLSQLRTSSFSEKGREYLKDRLGRLKEKAQSSKVKQMVEEAEKLLTKSGRELEEGLKKLLKAVNAERKKVLEKVAEKEQFVFAPKNRLVQESRSEKGRFFLTASMGGRGYPPADFSKFKTVFVATVPRPIKVQDRWQIQRSVKVLGGEYEEDGRRNVYAVEADRTAMKYDYPIYKVLSKLVSGQMKKGQPLTWSQVRALFGEGFESGGKQFKGLAALEKEFSKDRSGGAVYPEFIKFVRETVGDIIYKSDEEIKKMGEERAVKEVADRLSSNPVIAQYVASFRKFLEDRDRGRPIAVSKMLKEGVSHQQFVQTLMDRDILWQGRDGVWRINRERLKANLKSVGSMLKDGLSRVYSAAYGVARTFNFHARALEAEKKALRNAEAVKTAEKIFQILSEAVSLEPSSIERRPFVKLEQSIREFEQSTQIEAGAPETSQPAPAAEPEKTERQVSEPENAVQPQLVEETAPEGPAALPEEPAAEKPVKEETAPAVEDEVEAAAEEEAEEISAESLEILDAIGEDYEITADFDLEEVSKDNDGFKRGLKG
jgi:hypothetical protein